MKGLIGRSQFWAQCLTAELLKVPLSPGSSLLHRTELMLGDVLKVFENGRYNGTGTGNFGAILERD